jgi:signal transduction histidine kinase
MLTQSTQAPTQLPPPEVLAGVKPDITRAEAAGRIEELGKIIMAYSEVTDQMQKSHDELQRTVARLREELGEKNRLLERRKRLAALGEMAAGMAHEIRNPLGGIQLYASLLAGDLKHQEPQHRLVEKISLGVRRLESLVSQVLLFSREIRLDLGECELGEVVREAVELSGPRLQKYGAQIVINADQPVQATVDRTLIGQAVMNLLVNAAEAAGPTGTVTVTLADCPTTRRWKLRVADTGPGIPQEVMDKIFNPFFSTKGDGCGLGLSIVHRIAEAHDGVVRVSNNSGTTTGAVFELEARSSPH